MGALKESLLRGPKPLKGKTRTVTRSMTTGTALATLPKGARFLGAIIQGTASDAGTTATVAFGNTATATEFGSANVLAAGVGNGGVFVADATAQTVFTTPTVIYCIYAESGTASSVGDWTVTLVYTDGNGIAPGTV